MKRHEEELRNRPDVLGLLGSDEEIIIVTGSPETLPTEIEGVPVKTVPSPPTLPPPPGVIVLRPGGKREHLKDASSCPPGFREETKYRWRFCESLTDPEPIPSEIMTPPIAGIPYKEAEEIYKRNVDRLMELSGVNSVGLGADGITVNTDHPELVPPSVEGLPVKTAPRVRIRHTNHTHSTRTDPFHGGTAISDLVLASPPEGVGTACRNRLVRREALVGHRSARA